MIGEIPSLMLLNKSGWRQVSEEPLHHGCSVMKHQGLMCGKVTGCAVE